MMETEHFSVWSQESMCLAEHTAAECEKLRSSLQHAWGIADTTLPWRPKCAIVLHGSGAEMWSAVGGEVDSVGCTTITSDEGRVVFRRVDLRTDEVDWQVNALPHELTHIVLADRFPGKHLPPWLSEGLAMLSEGPNLRERRGALLKMALEYGRVPGVAQLIADGRATHKWEPNLMYAASLALVADLELRGGKAKLLEFTDKLLTCGCDVALKETYLISGGLLEWERRWLTSSPMLSSERHIDEVCGSVE